MKVKDCVACEQCPMRAKFPENNLVPPQMGPSLRLVIAEAPGAEEAIEGKPLVGGSGRIQDSLWRKAGVQRDQLTILNTVNCRPPNNAYPTSKEARSYCTESEGREIVSHCFQSHVKPVLESRPWDRIDAIGNESLKLLTGKTEGIMKWRGSPLPLKGETKPRVIGTLHPSYLMRDSARIPDTISDIQKGIQVPPQYYNTHPTVEEIQAFSPKQLVFDIETNRYTEQITMVGVSDFGNPYHVIVVPFAGIYIAELRRIFANAEEAIGQNIIQFDLPRLADAGVVISPDCQVWDIMLMYHLIAPDSAAYDLEHIASICTQMVAWKHVKADMPWYCAGDVDATAQSYRAIRPRLDQMKLTNLYKYVQIPLAKICKLMSDTGIKVDPNNIKKQRVRYIGELAELEAQLPIDLKPYDKPIKVRQLAPAGTLGKSGKPIKYIHVPSTERVVPWQSSKTVERYLYDKLALPKQLHAKTKKVTTDKTALDRLFRKTKLPFLKQLAEIRHLDEVIGTFLKDADHDKQVAVGRIHTNFLVHGTNTGRLASSSPNMQNVPPIAKHIYVPSHSDWCFVEADFSSLENRLASWYADDADRLKRLAIPGFNEHRWLASQIFNLPEEEINKKSDEYGRAKHTNHGADAGMGPRKMSVQYNIPEKDCKDLLTMWKKLNWASAQWQERTGNQAMKDGVLTTAFGRKRWFWSQTAYTEGIRFMLQSSGADICYRSMIALMYERIGWPVELALKVVPKVFPLPYPARLILQVHDSLLVECPYALVEEVKACLTAAMEQLWPELAGYMIPVAVKVGNPGESWGELKD